MVLQWRGDKGEHSEDSCCLQADKCGKCVTINLVLEICIFEQSLSEVALAKGGHLNAAVAVKHSEEAHALAVDVVVADVRVLHGEAPPLH